MSQRGLLIVGVAAIAASLLIGVAGTAGGVNGASSGGRAVLKGSDGIEDQLGLVLVAGNGIGAMGRWPEQKIDERRGR